MDAGEGSRAGVRFGVLSGRMGFHLRLAHVALHRDFLAAVAEFNLTQQQYAVLELIDANPGAFQVELAAALHMDRATMMALIDKLEARDLVRRTQSRLDRRRLDLHLTEAGNSLLGLARKAIAAHEARLFADWSVQDRESLESLLKRLYVARSD
jgi:DNA-binding MarR family transcriptional regulator